MLLVFTLLIVIKETHSSSEYDFFNSINQVILDRTGNSNTAINGLSLFRESEDVVWTDRGAYFTESSVVSLPPNPVASSSLAFLQDSSITIWILLSSSGTIFSKPDLSVEVFKTQIDLNVRFLRHSSLRTNSDLLGKWFLFCLTFDRSLSEFQVFINYSHMMTYAPTSKWIDNHGPFQLGGNLNAFIFNAVVYNGKISFEKFSNGEFFNKNQDCVSPTDQEGCLSTVADPGKNSLNLQCNCPSNVSCERDVNQCKHSTNCDDYATGSYPYICQDIAELCGEHQYIHSSRRCNFWCIDNCVSCSNATECRECAQELTLLSNKTCGCESGYFLSSQTCLPCTPSCKTCIDREKCTSCWDPTARIVNGICLDSSFASPVNNKCGENCKDCIESECIECHNGHDLVHSSCRKRILECSNYSDDFCVECSEGFYLNSNSECIACKESCLQCTSADTCTSCTDDKAELQSGTCNCNIAHSTMSNGLCECENGYIWYDNTTSSCVASFDLSLSLTPDNDISIKIPEELISFSNDSYDLLIDNQFSLEASLLEIEELSYLINITYSPGEIDENVHLIILFNSTMTTTTDKVINKTSYEFELNSNTDKVEGLKRIDYMTNMVEGTLLISFLCMMKLNDASGIWALLNAYQFIAYLPVLTLEYTEEVLDFFVSFQTARSLPNIFASFKSHTKLPKRFQEYGKEIQEWGDTHCVKNTGRYILLVVILVGLWMVYLVSGCLLPCKSFRESVERNRKKWRSLILRVFNCLNLDLMVCSAFALFSNVDDSLLSVFSGYLLSLLNIYFLFVLFIAPKQLNLAVIEEETVHRKFGTFLEELSNNSIWGSRYYFLLNIRKCVLSFSFYLLYQSPEVVLGVQICFSVVFCFYFLYWKVLNSPMRTALYLMSEFTILASFVCSFLIHYMPEYSWELGKIIITFNVGFLVCGSLMNVANAIHSFISSKNTIGNKKTTVIKVQPDIFSSIDEQLGVLNRDGRENCNEIRSHPIFVKRGEQIY